MCGFWDYGSNLGYSFGRLRIDTLTTLRATANGYKPAELRVVATASYSYTNFIILKREK